MSEVQDERIRQVRALMRQRETFRKQDDFTQADQLRLRLQAEFGVKVIDQKNGPSGWKFVDGSSNKLSSAAAGDKPLPIIEGATASVESETTTATAQKKRSRDNNDDAPPKTQRVDNKKEAKKGKPVATTNTSTSSSSTPASPAVAKSPSQKAQEEIERNRKALNEIKKSQSTTNNGIIIEELKIGDGRAAQAGNRIKVHYVGRLKSNDKVFDSSKNRPFAFRLGRGEVIKGWDIGCAGMKVGGKRKLTIPPEKAYGRQGAPPTIPGNATLVFDVTLLEVS